MEKKVSFFLLKFFAIFCILYAVLIFFPPKWLEFFIAQTEASWLNLPFDGNQVFVNGNVFEIGESCTGFVSGIILAAVVFALRKPDFKKKFFLFSIGFIVLFSSNFLRIYFVLLAGIQFGVKVAELVHVISWFTTSILIILLWYFLTKKLVKIKKFNELL